MLESLAELSKILNPRHSLKETATVVIPIVSKREMLHEKHESYRYILSLKNLVDWISTRQKKNVNIKNAHFEKRGPKVKKHISIS